MEPLAALLLRLLDAPVGLAGSKIPLLLLVGVVPTSSPSALSPLADVELLCSPLRLASKSLPGPGSSSRTKPLLLTLLPPEGRALLLGARSGVTGSNSSSCSCRGVGGSIGATGDAGRSSILELVGYAGVTSSGSKVEASDDDDGPDRVVGDDGTLSDVDAATAASGELVVDDFLLPPTDP